MSIDVHLAIYDKKNAGIVGSAIHLNPQKVILLHRKENDVEGVKAVLNSRGIKCESQMVSFDPGQIRKLVSNVIDRNKGNQILFNASSGYRMMVLVTLELFTSSNLKAFVMDKFTNQMHWLHPADKSFEVVDCKLKIAEYLKLFSAQVLSHGQTIQETHARQQLTAWLVDNISQFGSALASMNHIAMRADLTLSYRMDKKYHKKQNLQQILDRFGSAGILRQNHNTISFKDEESRFYANGGWLENHVFSTLFSMKKSRDCISDLSKGMEIARAKGAVKNEVDVVMMANNRLHLIECKTRKFTKQNHANTPGAAAIYRLDTLKELLGGNSGKAMLVSYQKLSRYTEQRALDLGIFCCSHNQLKQLKEYLYRFIDSKT